MVFWQILGFFNSQNKKCRKQYYMFLFYYHHFQPLLLVATEKHCIQADVQLGPTSLLWQLMCVSFIVHWLPGDTQLCQELLVAMILQLHFRCSELLLCNSFISVLLLLKVSINLFLSSSFLAVVLPASASPAWPAVLDLTTKLPFWSTIASGSSVSWSAWPFC